MLYKETRFRGLIEVTILVIRKSDRVVVALSDVFRSTVINESAFEVLVEVSVFRISP